MWTELPTGSKFLRVLIQKTRSPKPGQSSAWLTQSGGTLNPINLRPTLNPGTLNLTGGGGGVAWRRPRPGPVRRRRFLANASEDLGFRVWGLGFRVWGLGFGV